MRKSNRQPAMRTQPTRFLHIIHRLDPKGGGPPENLLQLFAAYREVGVEMEVLSMDAPDASYLARYPFKVYALGPTHSSFGFSISSRRWLSAHAHEYTALIIDGLWLHLGLVARRAALASRVPYLIFPHGTLDPWFRRTYPLKHIKKQIFWLVAQYRVLRDARAVMFTTEAERNRAQRTFWPPVPRGELVPLGTSRPPGDAETQREVFYHRCPQASGRRLLLFLSRMHEKKGCDLLLKAFARLCNDFPDVDLVMAGPDPAGMRAGLELIAEKAGCANRVHWPGMLQSDEKWGAFRAAEAFVLPSHQENFGIAIAEAIACRVPVLISNKINIWNYIAEDRTGFVEDDTEEGTYRLLRAWLEASAEEKAAMVKRTDAAFERRFSMLNCALRIRDLVSNGPSKAASDVAADRKFVHR